MLRFNKTYFLLTILLFCTEVIIALFVHDNFIRPYFGDVLVVIVEERPTISGITFIGNKEFEKELLNKRYKIFNNPKIKKSVKSAVEQIN